MKALPSVPVLVHPSQFPDLIEQERIAGLRQRRVRQKFHYESPRQAALWLKLHQAHSPWHTDPQCRSLYHQAFDSIVQRMDARVARHVVSLGCGAGEKDAQLLKRLRSLTTRLRYTPVDASVPLVLRAWQAGLPFLTPNTCRPSVCDITSAQDLRDVCPDLHLLNERLVVLLLGVLPNIAPETIFSQLKNMLGAGDFLLASANLAPGREYEPGVRKVVPQYDNQETRDWLLAFLSDHGVDVQKGVLRWDVRSVPSAPELLQITVSFQLRHPQQVELGTDEVRFETGDLVELFSSIRYTAATFHTVADRYGMQVLEEWISPSDEEGLFLLAVQSDG